MKHEIILTGQFRKDIKSAKKQGKDLNKLYHVIEILSDGEELEEKYHDHLLSGNYEGLRECHIEPDWLLIYTYKNDILVLILNRFGSYSELFKK